MRIGLDARFFGPSGKGIGRYTQQLISELEKLDSQNEYFVFLTKEGFDLYKPRQKNWHKVLVNCPPYSFKEQVVLPKILNQYQLDLVHFFHFNKPLFYSGKFIVTIHDLIHLKFNQASSTRSFWSYLIKHLVSRLVSQNTVKRGSKIIAVSGFVKKQIIEYYKINLDKIIVTYESTFMPSNIKHQTSNIKHPYLLYVGNAYPHKNLERLLTAFKVISADENICLVLVGKIDYFYQRLQKLAKNLDLTEKVIFAGQVNDVDLSVLYQNALAYVFPSLMEGFGLPGLEAMAHNCPVVSSKAGALPEIYGSAALYFNPEKVQEIVEAIKKIIYDNGLREELKKRGQAQIKKYSWDKCAKETLAVYKKI